MSSPSNIVGAPPSNIKLINKLKIHLKNEKSVYTNQDMKYLSPVLGDFQEALSTASHLDVNRLQSIR